MGKKSEIVVGGIIEDAPNGPAVMAALSPEVPSEEITTVDNPRRSSAPPAGAAPLSPEHAAELRRINHEAEPIPEGKLYSVRCFDQTGNPVRDLAVEPYTEFFGACTHAEAVERCAKANERAEAASALLWFGVAHAGAEL